MMTDFAKCFCLPQTLTVISAIGLFVMAFLIYHLLRFFFRKLIQRGGIWSKLGNELRHPVLLILFEIAAAISVSLLHIPENWAKTIKHIFNILIIATIGWFVASMTRAFYYAFIEKQGSGTDADRAKRSLLTQILFLYRMLMFMICAVTVASILLTFPYVKSVGLGILGSAGIAGIALGSAARPILLNLMVGFQIALTKMIKLGDAIYVEGEFARIESIHLTRVIACTWDLRRIVVPVSYFIDKPFQNWDLTHPELVGSIFLYCDYAVPINAIREKAKELLEKHPSWNRRVWSVQLTNCTINGVEIRVAASADHAAAMFDLRYHLREQLVEFLQKEYPSSLPSVRITI